MLASVYRTRSETGSLLLMNSTSMNAVDTRPSDVAREKTVVNQQMPSRRWPLTALKGQPALADLQCVWSTKTLPDCQQ